jgi:propionate CoA-transferase
MIDMIDGGLLDMTFLGAAEIDGKGNVNVSKFAGRSNGPGGFINISRTRKGRLHGDLYRRQVRYRDHGQRLKIHRDGDQIKFVRQLQQITFSGVYAMKNGQQIMFITERASSS